MAEALLRSRLNGRAPGVEIASAGLLFDGRRADEQARRVLARRGVDLDGFRSQRMTAELLERAGLVVGMERRHVREAEVLLPGVFTRSFTLPELARRAAGRLRPAGTALRAWAEGLAPERTRADYLLDDLADEVTDPYGAGGRTFRACAARLDELLDALVEAAWPTDPFIPATHGGNHADRDRR